MEGTVYDLEGKTLAAFKQPFWPQGVKSVFETLGKESLRTVPEFNGGGGGIRTPETLSSLTVFKTAGFNRSPTPPHRSIAFLSCNRFGL